ncbi:MAG: hypothetical protein ACI3XE_07100, partial [Eubacteriales bacterium]
MRECVAPLSFSLCLCILNKEPLGVPSTETLTPARSAHAGAFTPRVPRSVGGLFGGRFTNLRQV